MDKTTLQKIEFEHIRKILAEYSSCSLGKKLAAKISPSTKVDIIQNWLTQVSQMVIILRDFSAPPFGGITDISEPLERVCNARVSDPDDFSVIYNTLTGARNCKDFLNQLPSEMLAVKQLSEGLSDFETEITAIRKIIASDGTVRDDASPRLFEIRRNKESIAAQIHEVIHSYLRNSEVRKLLTSATVTLHGDRYVLPVRADNRGRLPGVVHRASNTGSTVFVEPNASVELNNKLVKLYDQEKQEIERLFVELGAKIIRRKPSIEKSVRILGQLDLLTAKAIFAKKFKMCCPIISQENQLELFQARHPLLLTQFAGWSAHHDENLDQPEIPLTIKRVSDANIEKSFQQVVPIDVRLGKDFDVLIITGSNTGGKTVTMKTVALNIAMMQCGMHIPARQGSTLPIFHDVLIDIGDEQSLEQSLSTFGGHIERLKTIVAKLRNKKKNQLVLLDELGSGTDPDEGGAIGQAMLDELQNAGCLAMVSTHLSVLKAYALNHNRVDNASVEFDTKTLRPTYNLEIGTAGESHAITVAEKLGLPGRITHTARKYLAKRGTQFRKALRKTSAARQIAEEARADAAQAQYQAQVQVEQYQQKIADVDKLKSDFSAWLTRLADLKPGDQLAIPNSTLVGTLERLDFKKQYAVVNLGAIQREIAFTELMPDLGQSSVRDELKNLRKEAIEAKRLAEQEQEKAKQFRKQASQLNQLQKEKNKQFENWTQKISQVKPGDEISIAVKPGKAKLEKIDFAKMQATVKPKKGESIELSLNELFPQTGPYSQEGKRKKSEHYQSTDKPIKHGAQKGKRASDNLRKVLKAMPGDRVFVIPFNSKAELVRIDEKRQIAFVLNGAFEMQVKLTDILPVKK